ncbi:hypothetical protein Dsin_001452, partial [Dipteronia sinensis]
YVQPPPLVIPYESDSTKFACVDRSIAVRDRLLGLLKQNLSLAQYRMKMQADKHRRKKEF